MLFRSVGSHGVFDRTLLVRVSGGAGGDAKDLTALGGKVGSAGPGVEAEEGEGVEIGLDGAKLLTLGVGEVDKDAVLQPGKAQVDIVKAASQEIVLEVLDVIRGLRGRGIKTARLGLVKKIIDEMNELGTGFGNFGDHEKRVRLGGGKLALEKVPLARLLKSSGMA